MCQGLLQVLGKWPRAAGPPSSPRPVSPDTKEAESQVKWIQACLYQPLTFWVTLGQQLPLSAFLLFSNKGVGPESSFEGPARPAFPRCQ